MARRWREAAWRRARSFVDSGVEARYLSWAAAAAASLAGVAKAPRMSALSGHGASVASQRQAASPAGGMYLNEVGDPRAHASITLKKVHSSSTARQAPVDSCLTRSCMAASRCTRRDERGGSAERPRGTGERSMMMMIIIIMTTTTTITIIMFINIIVIIMKIISQH